MTEDAVGRDGLVDALVRSAFTTMAVLTRIAAAHDLSLTQLRVLAILRDRRLRMTALAEFLGLEKSTMTGLVARAEERGLLRRLPGEGDGRAVDVVLGAEGVALGHRLRAEVAAALAPSTGELSGPERRRLEDLLDRLVSRP
ncbi:hypothetical protein GCM10009836_13310 [Pseudonocardia ailaonensis]|uniref:HTH marR-type domain-containing protein n=1 Tax=Pseudonocardia ailaonensis TaxID=367279 RepID=A0ABN2MSD5_9PSEU